MNTALAAKYLEEERARLTQALAQADQNMGQLQQQFRALAEQKAELNARIGAIEAALTDTPEFPDATQDEAES